MLFFKQMNTFFFFISDPYLEEKMEYYNNTHQKDTSHNNNHDLDKSECIWASLQYDIVLFHRSIVYPAALFHNLYINKKL